MSQPATTQPQVIGRYVLHGVLAAGGMATVHLGRLIGAAGFARTVAIKRMHAQFAQDPEFADMFLDEARLAGRIRHPNVVSVIDVVATEGEMLLVMEYVQGESLSRLVRRARERGEKVPQPVISAILCDALDGLHAAHEARDEKGKLLGIVHRDVSPQNIMVGADGIARVLDFGIAKASGRAQVTREGQLKGKLSYMAPEQLHGTVTAVTDVHAMGIVLWEALVGERLFAAETEGHTVTKILTAKVKPPSEASPGVDPAYDAIVLKALAKDPAERFQNAREMSIALAACARKADAHEVAEWIALVAKDVLDARADIVSKVETQPSLPDVMERASREPPDTRSDLSSDAVSATRPKSRRGPLIVAIASATIAVIAIAIFAFRAPTPPVAATSAAQPPPSATVPAALPAVSAAAPTTASVAQTPSASASTKRPVAPKNTGAPTSATVAAPRPNNALPDHL